MNELSRVEALEAMLALAENPGTVWLAELLERLLLLVWPEEVSNAGNHR